MNMNITKNISFIFRLSAAATLATSINAHAAGEPQYKNSDEASHKLQQYCDTTHFKTLDDHAHCLQETSGQVMTFAEKFYSALFTQEGITPDASLYKEMVSAWEIEIKTKNLSTAADDIMKIKEYPTVCSNMMQDNFVYPEKVLSLSYTTGYNIPKFCVDTALDFSKKYGTPIDNEDAQRLQQHLKMVYDFYTANPVIPNMPDNSRQTEMQPPQLFDPQNNLRQRGEEHNFWI